MPNSQIYPASPYPGTGDISTTTGSPLTIVTGIQSVPVDPTTPQPQQLLVMGSDGQWHAEDPVVSGPDSPGSVSSKPPVQVAGIDDGNLVRELRLDSSGTVVSTNLEKLLMLLISEVRKTNLILRDLSGNDPIGDQDGDFDAN